MRRFHHRGLFVALLVIVVAAAACRKARNPNVAAVVNGYNITNEELDKYFKAQTQGSSEKPDEEQAVLVKLNLLRELIDNQIMLQRAEKLGLMAVDADVETKLNEFKAPYTKEEFQKQLNNKKMTLEDQIGRAHV